MISKKVAGRSHFGLNTESLLYPDIIVHAKSNFLNQIQITTKKKMQLILKEAFKNH